MVKLVILIEPGDDNRRFEEGWPQFLHNAEEMPGLQREATSQVDTMLYGSVSYVMMHELFFNSLADAQQAMASPAGQAAGQTLQGITGGKLVLFFADHKEDYIANIRRFRPSQVGTER